MIVALHLDGVALLVASLCLGMLGQSYHRWRFRVPIFVMAFCDFGLSLNMLGLRQSIYTPQWFWLRVGADSAALVLAAIYFLEHRKHEDFKPPPKTASEI